MIDLLPTALIQHHVATYLECTDLINITLVCKTWRKSVKHTWCACKLITFGLYTACCKHTGYYVYNCIRILNKCDFTKELYSFKFHCDISIKLITKLVQLKGYNVVGTYKKIYTFGYDFYYKYDYNDIYITNNKINKRYNNMRYEEVKTCICCSDGGTPTTPLIIDFFHTNRKPFNKFGLSRSVLIDFDYNRLIRVIKEKSRYYRSFDHSSIMFDINFVNIDKFVNKSLITAANMCSMFKNQQFVYVFREYELDNTLTYKKLHDIMYKQNTPPKIETYQKQKASGRNRCHKQNKQVNFSSKGHKMRSR